MLIDCYHEATNERRGTILHLLGAYGLEEQQMIFHLAYPLAGIGPSYKEAVKRFKYIRQKVFDNEDTMNRLKLSKEQNIARLNDFAPVSNPIEYYLRIDENLTLFTNDAEEAQAFLGMDNKYLCLDVEFLFEKLLLIQLTNERRTILIRPPTEDAHKLATLKSWMIALLDAAKITYEFGA